MGKRAVFSVIAGWLAFWLVFFVVRADAPRRAPIVDSLPVPVIVGTVAGVAFWLSWALVSRLLSWEGRQRKRGTRHADGSDRSSTDSIPAAVPAAPPTRQTYFWGGVFAYLVFGVAYSALRGIASGAVTTTGASAVIYPCVAGAALVALGATLRKPWGWYTTLSSLLLLQVATTAGVLTVSVVSIVGSIGVSRAELQDLARQAMRDVITGGYTVEALARERKKALLYLMGRGRLEFDDLSDADKELLGLPKPGARATLAQVAVVGPAAILANALWLVYFYRRRAMFGAKRRWVAVERVAPFVIGPDQYRKDLPLPRFHRVKIVAALAGYVALLFGLALSALLESSPDGIHGASGPPDYRRTPRPQLNQPARRMRGARGPSGESAAGRDLASQASQVGLGPVGRHDAAPPTRRGAGGARGAADTTKGGPIGDAQRRGRQRGQAGAQRRGVGGTRGVPGVPIPVDISTSRWSRNPEPCSTRFEGVVHGVAGAVISRGKDVDAARRDRGRLLRRRAYMQALAIVLVVLLWPVTALAGWYLMTAPTKYVQSRKDAKLVETPAWDAPLHDWYTESSHDRAVECEAAKKRLVEESKEAHRYWRADPVFEDMMLRGMTIANGALCIATDDPRLRR